MISNVAKEVESSKKAMELQMLGKFDIAYSIITRVCRAVKGIGICSRRHVSGRLCSTAAADDKYTVLSVKRNSCTTACQVANKIFAATSKRTL